MRIAHVISGLKMGGAETLLVDMLCNLKDSRDEHIVIYFHAGHYVDVIHSLGVRLYHIKGFFSLYDPFFWIRFFRIIKDIKPDCIHGWLWSANVASRIVARILGIPQISSLHNNVDQDGFFRNFIDKYTYRYAKVLVPVSHGVAQSLRDKKFNTNQYVIHVIKNGISSKVSPHSAEQNLKNFLGKDSFVVGSVGRFVPLKNYGLLINSFAILVRKYEHAKLLLVGVGPEEEKLRSQVKKLSIDQSVMFIINKSAYQYYTVFDCFVLTSYKEGISIALLEAMNFGLPCVVTHDGPAEHDVIKDKENGLLVCNHAPGDVAEAMITLIENKELRRQLGEQALIHTKRNFSIERMTREYNALYKKIIFQE